MRSICFSSASRKDAVERSYYASKGRRGKKTRPLTRSSSRRSCSGKKEISAWQSSAAKGTHPSAPSHREKNLPMSRSGKEEEREKKRISLLNRSQEEEGSATTVFLSICRRNGGEKDSKKIASKRKDSTSHEGEREGEATPRKESSFPKSRETLSRRKKRRKGWPSASSICT